MKLLAAGTLLFFLLGCTRFQEREVRKVSVKSDCQGSKIEVILDKDYGQDAKEIKGPAQ